MCGTGCEGGGCCGTRCERFCGAGCKDCRGTRCERCVIQAVRGVVVVQGVRDVVVQGVRVAVVHCLCQTARQAKIWGGAGNISQVNEEATSLFFFSRTVDRERIHGAS